MDYIVTVMAKDRVGIVRDITTAIAGLDGNITDLSQTVLQKYFTLIITVQVPNNCTADNIKCAIESKGEKDELGVLVKSFDATDTAPLKKPERFTLSVIGKDNKGIMARMTSIIADCRINLDDIYSYTSAGKLIMLAQVSVSENADIEDLHKGIESLKSEFDLVVNLQHEDIFRATSEIRPILSLGEEAL